MSASAGTRGADARSDCWIEVSPARGAAPRIEIESQVKALYGDAIRRLIESTLETLEARDLDVRVEDAGALPFTLMARLEAAVKRLRPQTGGALPDKNPAAQYAPAPEPLYRSRLYLPGNTPKFFVNAGLYGADALILDLEDAVAPEEKDAARMLVRNALRAVNFYGASKIVRINALPAGLDDVRELAAQGVHAFHVPKVEEAESLRALAQLLDELADTDDAAPEIRLLPIVETARGVMNAYAIATASPRIAALSIGLEDYTRDIGAERTQQGRESAWALGQVINAARAAGVVPLASVYPAVDDEEGMTAWAREVKQLGFEGVGCLHPRQVTLANRVFTPTRDEIERAQRIVDAFAGARAEGLGVVRVDGQMVDAPVAARAERTLRLARMGGTWQS